MNGQCVIVYPVLATHSLCTLPKVFTYPSSPVSESIFGEHPGFNQVDTKKSVDDLDEKQ